MPTGYTAAVQDGTVTDFRTFAMNCARAFGACIELRDEAPGGDKIPAKFDPSDYHAKAVEEAKQRLAELEAMPSEYASERARECYAERSQAYEDRKAKRLRHRERYEAMLAKVRQWHPPTPDHVNMRDFMLNQLEESISFDCNGCYDLPPVQETGAEWLRAQIAACKRDIEYHGREHAEDVKRTNERNAWIAALRESLKETP